MRKLVISSTLGLSIVACSMALTTPASAILDSGPQVLRNLDTGFCLAVDNGTANLGANIIVWPCDGSISQQWSSMSEFGTSGYYHLKSSVFSNRFAGVQGGVVVNGTAVIDWTQTADLNQGWGFFTANITVGGHPCYYIANYADPSKVLGVLGGSKSAGAQVVVWDNFQDIYNHRDQVWCTYPAGWKP